MLSETVPLILSLEADFVIEFCSICNSKKYLKKMRKCSIIKQKKMRKCREII